MVTKKTTKKTTTKKKKSTKTTYTFYLCSDNNTTKSTDSSRLKQIGKTLKKMGHKTVYVGVGSSSQWNAPAKGCTGQNDVLLFVVSGIDVGNLEEWGSTLGNYWKSKFKKAKPFMIKLMSGTERRTVGDKKTVHWGSMNGGTSTGFYQSIGRAGDANYGYRLSNPANYCKQHGISFLQGGGKGGINDILDRLKKGDIGGAGLNITGDKSTEDLKDKEVSIGFSDNNPFSAYLKIGYIIKDKDGNKSKIRYITIDWSEEAPDTSTKWSNSDSDGKDISLSWVNNKHTKFEIELLSKIQSIEKKYDDKSRSADTNKYIIKTIDLVSYIPKKATSNTKAEKNNESLLYEPSTDQSSYKMNLYNIGFFNGDIINDQTLGISAKSLLDGINTILNESNYLCNMKYGEHRESDSLNFRTRDDTQLNNIEELEEFNEFVNGNIIGLSNITFSPVSDMCNTNIVIYKTVSGTINKKNTYHHAKTTNVANLLRYGELSKINKSETITSYVEARQKSYDDYLDNFNTQVTYTARIAGLPYTELNDYVQAVTIDERLSGAYQLCSKTIHVSTKTRPMVQTECGMGAISTELSIFKNLEKQRKELVKFKADINEPISYEGEINLIGE